METTIWGIVKGGVIVPSSPLPDGSQVEIRIWRGLEPPGTRVTASDLRKLPRAQRQAILAAAAAVAEQDYQSDNELTDFAAFAEEQDDDDSDAG